MKTNTTTKTTSTTTTKKATTPQATTPALTQEAAFYAALTAQIKGGKTTICVPKERVGEVRAWLKRCADRAVIQGKPRPQFVAVRYF